MPAVSTGTANPRVRLFCLPYLGGTAAVYRAWQAALGPEVEVLPLDLPGHGSRLAEAPLTSIGAIAGAVSSALPAELAGRYALFGYSMGAMVAFEMARLAISERLPPPAHLFVAAAPAPSLPRRELPASAGSDAEILDALRRYEGVPEAVFRDPELAALLIPALRASLRAVEAYSGHSLAQLDVPITAIGGDTDPTVSRSEIEAWRDHTLAHFRLIMVPGRHFFIHSNGARLLREVAADLAPLLAG